MLNRSQERAVIAEMKRDPSNAETAETLTSAFRAVARELYDVRVEDADALVAVVRAFPEACA